MHAAVESSFPPTNGEKADTDDARVLWRIDRAANTSTLYVVSPRRPDLTHLVEQAGWPSAEQGWETRDYSTFLESLDTGQRWAFRLTANPTRQVSVDKRRRPAAPGAEPVIGKRLAHLTVEHQTNWLLARAQDLGLSIPQFGEAPQVAVIDQRRLTFGHGSGRKPIVMVAVTFDGGLQVEDPARLRGALTRGIGRGKAFGCGLMTLAPWRG
jgi:CRISPR system Cascade subunit CasE